jgi:hypothetical protein
MKFTLTIDKWEGNIDKGTSYQIRADDVKGYLQLLDGKEHTLAVIVPDDNKSSLMIGGGNDGIYVVVYTVGADEDFYNLTDPGKTSDRELEVIAGGQAGSRLEKYCVNFESALTAATYYVKTAERSPDLQWELQV